MRVSEKCERGNSCTSYRYMLTKKLMYIYRGITIQENTPRRLRLRGAQRRNVGWWRRLTAAAIDSGAAIDGRGHRQRRRSTAAAKMPAVAMPALQKGGGA